MTTKDAILKVVESHPGIHGVLLVVDVIELIGPTFIGSEYETTIQKLIDDEEITELEYILPRMSYRIKSLYFPKETTFPNPFIKRE